MARNQPQKPAKAAFSYGEVETALARVFGYDTADQHGWLRGRLQHMRRLGLVADSPGRGRTIEYTREDAVRWLVAIELAHAGADPVLIVDLIKRAWEAPRKRPASDAFARGEASLGELVEEARKSRVAGSDVIVTVYFGPLGPESKKPIVGCTTVKGMASLGHWLNANSPPRRAIVFSLSSRLRALDAALAEAVKPKTEPPISDASERIADMGRVRRGEMPLEAYRRKHRGKRSK
jgi:hypothetical protein